MIGWIYSDSVGVGSRTVVTAGRQKIEGAKTIVGASNRPRVLTDVPCDDFMQWERPLGVERVPSRLAATSTGIFLEATPKGSQAALELWARVKAGAGESVTVVVGRFLHEEVLARMMARSNADLLAICPSKASSGLTDCIVSAKAGEESLSVMDAANFVTLLLVAAELFLPGGHDPADVVIVHLFGEAAMQRLAHPRRCHHRHPLLNVGRAAPPQVGDLTHEGAVVGVDALRELLEVRDDRVVAHVELPEHRRRIGSDIGRTPEHREGQTPAGFLLVVPLIPLLRLTVDAVGDRVTRTHDAVLESQMLELEGTKEWIIHFFGHQSEQTFI